MLGMSALAFITPELPKLDEMISGVSSSIERPLNDFERNHNNAVPEKTVKEVMLRVYNSQDIADKASSEAKRVTNVLLHGTAQEIESLHIVDDSVIRELHERATYIENGVHRIKYAFFIARSNPAWHPHIRTLKHLELRLIPSYENYVKNVKELADTAQHFIPTDEGFEFDINELSSGIESQEVTAPSWVKTNDDFIKWVREYNKK
ncbi:hypothetical protein ACQFN5_23530 [Klebsiella sp. WOUb02]|uniref:hypothetical protein n=1 Tax=Klebsiella sp. WOUb02 TaxID=3161071 RepID=UPI003CEB2B05